MHACLVTESTCRACAACCLQARVSMRPLLGVHATWLNTVWWWHVPVLSLFLFVSPELGTVSNFHQFLSHVSNVFKKLCCLAELNCLWPKIPHKDANLCQMLAAVVIDFDKSAAVGFHGIRRGWKKPSWPDCSLVESQWPIRQWQDVCLQCIALDHLQVQSCFCCQHDCCLSLLNFSLFNASC